MRKGQYLLLFSYTLYRIVTLYLLLLIHFLTHPLRIFARRKVFPCPPSLQDQSLGMHQFITVNGIKLHYVISGPENAPVMLMLHGFPEFWYSWRYQIREFNKDYRVIAVDLRGYGESDKPLDKSAYTRQQLTSDIIELISSMCQDKCILVAHDWGGILAWRVVQQRPDLVKKFIVLCCPHAKRYMELVRTDNATLLRQWYVLLFQIPLLPELTLGADNYLSLKRTFHGTASGLINSHRMDDDSMQAFLYTFSQENALKCPLYYYRNMFAKDIKIPKAQKVEVPTLLMMGVHDAFLSLELGEGNEKYVEDIRVKNINGSHWLQQDCPDEVNKEIRVFLET
ncbi:Epoxide hydrolase 4-like [Oopsacas minuta]|uniref:Epoxide hydrolase 4-like n=1 Tax=Oopsacas minuta TaxID=111878 RepID=A0AAV7JY35_9METZ|nr:Epoxide hydrolase 4-like [Oopsacas minuta]